MDTGLILLFTLFTHADAGVSLLQFFLFAFSFKMVYNIYTFSYLEVPHVMNIIVLTEKDDNR